MAAPSPGANAREGEADAYRFTMLPRLAATDGTSEPLLLRVEDVARALSLGRSKVYELIASGELPSITIGSARRVPTEALQKWIAEHIDAAGGR